MFGFSPPFRFHRTADGGFNEGSTNYGASTLLDSAITDPNSSSLLPSSLAFGNLNAPRAAPALESAAVAAHPTKGVSHYFHGNGSGGAFNDGTKGVPRESASGGGGGGEARSHGVAARNLKELADQVSAFYWLYSISAYLVWRSVLGRWPLGWRPSTPVSYSYLRTDG